MAKHDLEIDLSGNHWKFEKIRPGAGVEEGFHSLPSEYQGTYFNWNQASVPGDVYTDLQRAGELDDLLMGRNMHKARWAMEYEYWYVCKFNVTEAMKGRRIELLFEGVDYSFEAWLNGEYLGRHEGMYSAAHFDITDKARHDPWYEGCNILMIRLEPPPRNYRRVAGRKFCFAGERRGDIGGDAARQKNAQRNGKADRGEICERISGQHGGECFCKQVNTSGRVRKDVASRKQHEPEGRTLRLQFCRAA